MSLSFDFSGFGVWELMYTKVLSGDIKNWNSRPKTPAIDPEEIPFLFSSRIFMVGASNVQKTWFKAGTLYYQVDGIKVDDRLVFPQLNAVPFASADAGSRLIKLNSIDLVVFPRYSEQVRLRFEAVPWLDRLTLMIWEYKGQETDSTEETLNALRARIETIDFKIDTLRR